MNSSRTLQLPEEICAVAEKWMPARFENLESFIIFLLREIVKDDGSSLDEQEELMVQQRLRDLGYM